MKMRKYLRLRAAFEFLLPYANEPSEWSRPQLKPIQPSHFHELVLRAMDLFEDYRSTPVGIGDENLESIDLELMIWFYPMLFTLFPDR